MCHLPRSRSARRSSAGRLGDFRRKERARARAVRRATHTRQLHRIPGETGRTCRGGARSPRPSSSQLIGRRCPLKSGRGPRTVRSMSPTKNSGASSRSDRDFRSRPNCAITRAYHFLPRVCLPPSPSLASTLPILPPPPRAAHHEIIPETKNSLARVREEPDHRADTFERDFSSRVRHH